jgi:DNA processing protein
VKARGRRTPRSPDPATRRKALALSLLPGVGAVRYRELAARFGSASEAFDAEGDAPTRAAALAEADEIVERAARCGAQLIQAGDADYPPTLLELHDPPPALYCIGNVSLMSLPSVAIVGTRRATAYGERVTRELALALARGGAVVVSGLARGIDAAAHRAVLEAGGLTVAVLGTGVDVAYPLSNRALQAEIAERGLLVSEEQPGSRATTSSFPKRNRIIAAITRATIIVEAPLRSGALITAEHATDLNRTVAAVPGPIDSPQSAGSNLLLRDCATAIASVDDALAIMGITPQLRSSPEPGTAAERRVLDALALGPTDLDSLATLSGLPARDCLAAVTTLELRGAVVCELTGEVRIR